MPTKKIYYKQHREAGQMERQKEEGVTHSIRPCLGHYHEGIIVDDGNHDAYEESFDNMPGTDRAWH